MLLALLFGSAVLVVDGLPRPEGEAFQAPPTIAGSVDSSVEIVLQAHADEILRLRDQLARVKQVADDTAGCIRSAFVFAGGDIISTAAAKERCATCSEQNPLGFSDLSVVGMKLGQLGSQIVTCYEAAKKGEQASRVVTWINRVIHSGAIGLNLISAITGKPVFKWREAAPAK